MPVSRKRKNRYKGARAQAQKAKRREQARLIRLRRDLARERRARAGMEHFINRFDRGGD